MCTLGTGPLEEQLVLLTTLSHLSSQPISPLWCFIVYAFKFNVPLVLLTFKVRACDKFPSG